MSRVYLHFVKKFFLLEILVVSRPYVTEVAIVVIERYQSPHYNHHRPFLIVRAGVGLKLNLQNCSVESAHFMNPALSICNVFKEALL